MNLRFYFLAGNYCYQMSGLLFLGVDDGKHRQQQVQFPCGYLSFSSVQFSRSVVSDSLRPCGLQPTRLLCPWDSSGKNTGVGCHFLLQGIFRTQGSNPGLLHCRQTLYHLSHQGSPNKSEGDTISASLKSSENPMTHDFWFDNNPEVSISAKDPYFPGLSASFEN